MIILWKRRSLIQITQESEWILGLNHLIGGFVLYRLSLQDVYIVMAFSATTIHTVSILFFLYVRFDECLLDFWYNSHMERKIFNYQYDSRIKVNFDDFKSCYWHLRSTIGKYDCVGGVGRSGLVSIYCIMYDCFGVLPVCTIWKID